MRSTSTLATALLMSLAFAFNASQAVAEGAWRSGNQLQNECKKQPPAFAYGYVFGLLDGYDVGEQSGASRLFCPPQDVTGEQLFDVMCRYIDSHPQDRQVPASYLAFTALTDAWPCPK
ncbi:Rap1a/Tai family immunity protein [Mesorhizobium sp. ArgA1]